MPLSPHWSSAAGGPAGTEGTELRKRGLRFPFASEIEQNIAAMKAQCVHINYSVFEVGCHSLFQIFPHLLPRSAFLL